MKFYIYTLGCKVNTYESNVMGELLEKDDFIKVSDPKDADFIIVNTCTVTNMADNKSLKLIRQVNRANSKAVIVVCGCMPQHDYRKLISLNNVGIIIGNKNKSKISDYIKKYMQSKKQIIDIYDLKDIPFEEMKLNNFDKTRAFVKIQDGCNNFCSYCIIPYTRGNVRSKNPKEVLDEINKLIDNGHDEVVLTGIHTGHYGSEFENYNFGNLLNDILKIKKLKRLRISSIEITEITDEILEIIKNNKVLVDHMHIPLQSGSDLILKNMNRKYDKVYFINKINQIRKIRPDISITTDVIVGFPGETDELFDETIDTIKKTSFTKLHVFPYSRRTGTKADLMENQVSDVIKKERVKVLMKLSKDLEINYMNKFLNEEVDVIAEIEKEGYLYGHSGNYLYIKFKGCKEMLHKNVKVEIKQIEYPYCIGEIK